MPLKSSIILSIFVSIACSLPILAEQNVAETLRIAHVLFRHGARAPIGTYPSDPHRNYPWVGGFGALTTLGAVQGFALGRNLRYRRYEPLIPANGVYSSQDMYIASCAHERCIMTAQSLLAGFLEPPQGAVGIPLPWQPAAVNVLAEAEDSIIAQTKPCPKYDQATAEALANPPEELAQWLESLPDQYEFATRHAGKVINTTYELEVFYDAIDIEAYNRLELPDWTEEVYPDKTKAYHEGLLLKFSATPEMQRLRGGVILTEILKHMKAKRDGTLDPDRSLYFYSGQDLTQVSLLHSMGMINQTTASPAFASAVAIELHKNLAVAPDLEVRMVYYEDSNTPDPRYLTIPGCSDPCALDSFELALQHLYVADFDEACRIESDAGRNSISAFLLVLSSMISWFHLHNRN